MPSMCKRETKRERERERERKRETLCTSSATVSIILCVIFFLFWYFGILVPSYWVHRVTLKKKVCGFKVQRLFKAYLTLF